MSSLVQLTMRRIKTVCLGFAILSIVFVVSLTSGVVAEETPIEVEADFSGDMIGYGDGAQEDLGDRGNAIIVNGEMTFSGETADNPTVTIQSAEYTVIDRSSVRTFVEGEAVDFVTSHDGDEVRMNTDTIPEGTTIEVRFDAYFTGGTTSSEIIAGTVSTDFQTKGGTPDDASFDVTADSSYSSDNMVRGEDETSTIRQILFWGGIVAILVLFGQLVYRQLQTPEY